VCRVADDAEVWEKGQVFREEMSSLGAEPRPIKGGKKGDQEGQRDKHRESGRREVGILGLKKDLLSERDKKKGR